ncbi:Protein of unknown function (DUF506) [Quillaja saponaria]|uniref:Uncharacterized protein n=1 Tax=Quillaja saponaria TaxID=32244 RepID=A0AAD7KWP8_QUISA|nr:Protein of unknown function (DUF506) [Quillaja saponaria]
MSTLIGMTLLKKKKMTMMKEWTVMVVLRRTKAFGKTNTSIYKIPYIGLALWNQELGMLPKKHLGEIESGETICACGRPMAAGCRSCLMREISGRLQNAGYNSAICKSKWRSSPDHVPSGEHSFLDVIDNTRSKKGEVRVIIEPNFRAEFEMAKASEEYNRLVRKLPEVFVGKVERLDALVKILCMAAKKCMKEKKMHLGPWRKQKYMQAKWLSACERTTSTPLLSMDYSGRLQKSRASMLTVDLHCTALEVV